MKKLVLLLLLSTCVGCGFASTSTIVEYGTDGYGKCYHGVETKDGQSSTQKKVYVDCKVLYTKVDYNTPTPTKSPEVIPCSELGTAHLPKPTPVLTDLQRFELQLQADSIAQKKQQERDNRVSIEKDLEYSKLLQQEAKDKLDKSKKEIQEREDRQIYIEKMKKQNISIISSAGTVHTGSATTSSIAINTIQGRDMLGSSVSTPTISAVKKICKTKWIRNAKRKLVKVPVCK